MAGQKGKSGRKTHYEEMAIAEVVNLSIKTVRDYLLDPNIPREKKAFLAKDFALKRIPNKIENLNPEREVIIIHNPKEKEVLSASISERISV